MSQRRLMIKLRTPMKTRGNLFNEDDLEAVVVETLYTIECHIDAPGTDTIS